MIWILLQIESCLIWVLDIRSIRDSRLSMSIQMMRELKMSTNIISQVINSLKIGELLVSRILMNRVLMALIIMLLTQWMIRWMEILKLCAKEMMTLVCFHKMFMTCIHKNRNQNLRNVQNQHPKRETLKPQLDDQSRFLLQLTNKDRKQQILCLKDQLCNQ